MNDYVFRVWDNQCLCYTQSANGRTYYATQGHAQRYADKLNHYRGKRPKCVVHKFKMSRVDYVDAD